MGKILRFTFVFVLTGIALLLLLYQFAYAEETQDNSPIKSVEISNYGTYPGAKLWLNCLTVYDYEKISDNCTVQYFLTAEDNGPIENAVIIGKQLSVGDEKEYVGERSINDALRRTKYDGGLFLNNLPSGTYYIGCEIDTGAFKHRAYRRFIVYETIKDYIKEGIDTIIQSYADHWYIYNNEYVGLDIRTDDFGNEWEAWIFPALGTEYPYRDRNISFGINDRFLHPGETTSYLSRYVTDKTQNELILYGTKQLFKDITSLAATGYDPRNVFGKNYVRALADCFYDDGKPAINADGFIYLPEDPETDVDLLVLSYGILGLEIADAKPDEGYTRELKEAMIRTMSKSYSDKYLQDNKILINDTFMMSLLPVHFMDTENEYASRLKAICGNSGKLLYKYNLGINGSNAYVKGSETSETWGEVNANTLAVALNTLVLNGLGVDELSIGNYQKEYGSIISALCGEIVDGGILYGDTVNRMATYQTLGALVDLYNGKSCFEIACEKYQQNYPEYFTDEYGKLTMTSVSEIAEQQYTGEPITPEVSVIGKKYNKLVDSEGELVKDVDYTVEYKDNTEPGKATVVITGIGDYYGTLETSFNIIKEDDGPVVAKKKQPMTVKPVLKKVSFKKLKKKAQVVKGALIVKNNKGKVSYKRIGGSRKLTINKKTGRITVKKKTKKGTYKIRVKVTAAGNSLFKAGSKIVTVKIRVK